MFRHGLGEGETSLWLRPSPFRVGLSPVGGTSTSIELVVEGGGGRENVWRADVVTESDLKSCGLSGVGVAGCGRKMAAMNPRTSLDSSRLKVLIADSIHWGLSLV